MKKGCGFIFLSIVGLTAISILYYTLEPLIKESTPEDDDNTLYTTGYVAEVLEFNDENKPSDIILVPMMEFTVADTFILDTAYHLRVMIDKSEIDNAPYQHGDIISLSVNAENYKDYKIVDEATIVGHELQYVISEYSIVLLIIGSILMLIFLRGLSKTFAYKESPANERIR